jgi:hypothetical protein
LQFDVGEWIRIIGGRRFPPESDESILAVTESFRRGRSLCPDAILAVPDLVKDRIEFGRLVTRPIMVVKCSVHCWRSFSG